MSPVCLLRSLLTDKRKTHGRNRVCLVLVNSQREAMDMRAAMRLTNALYPPSVVTLASPHRTPLLPGLWIVATSGELYHTLSTSRNDHSCGSIQKLRQFLRQKAGRTGMVVLWEDEADTRGQSPRVSAFYVKCSSS